MSKIEKIRGYFLDDGSKLPLVNNDILKQLLQIKRENKINYLYLKPVPQINQIDFMKFLENHMATNSFIVLVTNVSQVYDKLTQMLDGIKNVTSKIPNGDWIKVSFETFSFDK